MRGPKAETCTSARECANTAPPRSLPITPRLRICQGLRSRKHTLRINRIRRVMNRSMPRQNFPGCFPLAQTPAAIRAIRQMPLQLLLLRWGQFAVLITPEPSTHTPIVPLSFHYLTPTPLLAAPSSLGEGLLLLCPLLAAPSSLGEGLLLLCPLLAAPSSLGEGLLLLCPLLAAPSSLGEGLL